MGYQGGALHPPMRTGTRMNPMKILYKFGALGPASGQFHSPHGFCLTKDGEILVADTNNHRIQVSNKQYWAYKRKTKIKFKLTASNKRVAETE